MGWVVDSQSNDFNRPTCRLLRAALLSGLWRKKPPALKQLCRPGSEGTMKNTQTKERKFNGPLGTMLFSFSHSPFLSTFIASFFLISLFFRTRQSLFCEIKFSRGRSSSLPIDKWPMYGVTHWFTVYLLGPLYTEITQHCCNEDPSPRHLLQKDASSRHLSVWFSMGGYSSHPIKNGREEYPSSVWVWDDILLEPGAALCKTWNSSFICLTYQLAGMKHPVECAPLLSAWKTDMHTFTTDQDPESWTRLPVQWWHSLVIRVAIQ